MSSTRFEHDHLQEDGVLCLHAKITISPFIVMSALQYKAFIVMSAREHNIPYLYVQPSS